MSDTQVRILKKSEYEIWDELVDRSPHGTIFHTSDWLNICSEFSDKELKIYGCFEKEALIGGCSLFVNKNIVFDVASSISSMTPYGGMVLDQSPDDRGKRQLHRYNSVIGQLCGLLYEEGLHSISITNSPDFFDIRPFTWNGWDCNVKYAYYVNLEKDINKDISKGIREDVRKALKNGIETRRTRDPDRNYELVRTLFKDQGLEAPVEKLFFERVFKLMESRDMGDMWVSQTPSGEIIASNIVLWDNKRAYGWSAASDPEFKKLGANVLLVHEVFKDLKAHGFKEINCMSGNTPQFTEFIVGFHPSLNPYYEIKKEGYSYRSFKAFKDTFSNMKKK